MPDIVQANAAARSRHRPVDARRAAAGLLEREREAEQIQQAITAAREGRGSLTMLEGAAGLGKSRLLRFATERADERKVRVLRARSGEPERDFSFGVALQLFERRLATASRGEREEILSGAAALTVPLFAGEHWGRVRPPAQPAMEGLLHGLFWLTSNLADKGPLLLAVDDVHWCDEPSLRFMIYLLSRLEELPVAVIATRRPAESAGLVSELAGNPLGHRISLRPLSPAAVARLIEDELEMPVEERFASSCHQATGGNPFLVEALIQSLQADELEPRDENAAAIAEVRPEVVRHQTLVRISRLGEDAVALASAAAVLGDGALLAHVAALAGLDPDAAADAADGLVRADILSQPEPLAFAHPLVWGAVYEELPAGQRGRLHVRAARLLHDEQAAPELVSAQLLPAVRVGELWAAQTLRVAAERALRAGSAGAAVRYLTRALREPIIRTERSQMLLELARAKAMLGESSAIEDLEQALSLIEDPRIKARGHQTLGSVLYTRGDPGGAAEQFEQGLMVLEDPDDSLVHELQAAYYSAASLIPELVPKARERIEPLLGRPPGEETQAERGALAGAAVYLAISGAPREQAIALAQRAWGDGKLLEDEGPDGWAWSMVTGAFSWAGAPGATLDVIGEVIEQARRRGSLMAYATASFCAVEPAHIAGRLAESAAFAEAALDGFRYGWRTFPAALAGHYAQLLVDQDELAEAERQLEVLEQPDFGNPAGRAIALISRGRLRLVQGRPQDSLADLLAGGAVFGQLVGESDSFTMWRADAAVAADQIGQRDQAAELVQAATRIAQGTGTPTHLTGVLRARAQLEPDSALELLRQALDVLEDSQAHTERIRVQAELGAALRRAGQRSAARETLRLALEQAHAIGARRIERLAHEELKVAGARPRRLAFSGADALTASERRVAEMASQGLGNREIAQALFVTARTVEQHLYNTYKKLGIKSRSDLAQALRSLAHGD
jgi:DNA-binding CsgD family transcriptional regulator